jgi:hypothetical protein
MALDGKICLCLHPPDYSSKKGKHGNCTESFNFDLRHGLFIEVLWTSGKDFVGTSKKEEIE